MYLKKEEVKLKCFKTTLENGKKFVQQAGEAMLRMKMMKAGLVLRGAPDDERLQEERMHDIAEMHGRAGM